MTTPQQDALDAHVYGITGIEYLRTAPAEEIAEMLASGHPPVGVVHCDVVSCRNCWLHWLQSGGPIPCTCAGKEAKA